MNLRSLCLHKNGQTYLLRYEPGQEDRVIEHLMYMADDRDCDVDWMDTAALSYQVTQWAAEERIAAGESDEVAMP